MPFPKPENYDLLMQPLDLTRAANLHEESLSSIDSDCVEIDQESKLLDLTSTALLADPSCIKDRLAKVNKETILDFIACGLFVEANSDKVPKCVELEKLWEDIPEEAKSPYIKAVHEKLLQWYPNEKDSGNVTPPPLQNADTARPVRRSKRTARKSSGSQPVETSPSSSRYEPYPTPSRKYNCGKCGLPARSHDCPYEWRYTPRCKVADFKIIEVIARFPWRANGGPKEEDSSYFYEVRWTAGSDQPTLVPYEWLLDCLSLIDTFKQNNNI